METLISEIQLGSESFIEISCKMGLFEDQNNLLPFQNYHIIIAKNKPNEKPKIEGILNLSKMTLHKGTYPA